MTRNVALVGCGAIAQTFYCPAIAALRETFGEVWLVDPSDTARAAAASVARGRQARQLSDVDDELGFIIVATPNGLHFSVATEAVLRGAAVLVEKPFVVRPSDGEALLALSTARGSLIAVNQTRRLSPLAQALRERVNTGEFGELREIHHAEGTRLVWPFESGAAFERGADRTGAIMDFGVHVLDFYHYLLRPTWSVVAAIHDGFCGPEGLAELRLLAGEAPVSVRLSRYHPQANTARMVFESAEVAFDVYDADSYTVSLNEERKKLFRLKPNRRSVAETLLLNFVAASQGGQSAVCDAASSLPVIRVLDDVYRLASRYRPTPGAV